MVGKEEQFWGATKNYYPVGFYNDGVRNREGAPRDGVGEPVTELVPGQKQDGDAR